MKFNFPLFFLYLLPLTSMSTELMMDGLFVFFSSGPNIPHPTLGVEWQPSDHCGYTPLLVTKRNRQEPGYRTSINMYIQGFTRDSSDKWKQRVQQQLPALENFHHKFCFPPSARHRIFLWILRLKTQIIVLVHLPLNPVSLSLSSYVYLGF